MFSLRIPRFAVAALALCCRICPSALAVEPAQQVRFRVVDEAGRPIGGATVVSALFLNGTLTQVQTDAKGEAVFPEIALTDNLQEFMAGKADKTLGSVSISKTTPKPTMTLLSVRPIELRLVDEKASPVADAKIILQYRQPIDPNPSANGVFIKFPDYLNFGLKTSVVSDAQGKVILPFGADKDVLGLKIEKSGFQTVPCTLSVPDDNNLTIRLVPGATLRGRLVDKANQPLGGISIGFGAEIQKTDAKGNFFLEGLDETSGFLKMWDDKLTLSPQRIETQRGQILDLGTLTATPGAVVRGRILDEKGQPYLGGGIVQNRFADQDVYFWSNRGELDKQGGYELRFPPGKFVLQAILSDGKDGMSNVQWPRGTKDVPNREVTIQEGVDVEIDFKIVDRPRPAPVRPNVRSAVTKKPALPDYVYGRVVSAATGAPTPAKVSIFQGNQVIMDVQAKADGKFALGPLVSPINPAGAYANIDNSQNAPPLYLWAQAPGFLSAPVAVAGLEDQMLTLALERSQELKVRVVTTDGQPITGAKVSLSKITPPDAPDRNGKSFWPLNLFPNSGMRLTDKEGILKFSGLPASYVELHLEGENYADFNHVVAVPRPDTVDLTLPREAVVEGTVRWDDGRPFDLGGARVKLQAFRKYQLWLTGEVDKTGHFEVGKIPPLEMMGEETLGIDLLIDGKGPKVNNRATIAPGLTAEYIAFGRNWTLVITQEKDGVTKRWLSYIQTNSLGLKYQEGERIQHDMVLVPMARLQGKVVTEGGKLLNPQAYVTYSDPNNIMGYEMPQIKPDPQGNFELWVPAAKKVDLWMKVGDGNTRFGNPTGGETLQVLDLNPQETREIQWKVKNENLGGGHAMIGRMSPLIKARVIGPDGATIPRPLLSHRTVTSGFGSNGRALGGMDGTVNIYQEGDGDIEITSPYLKEPFKITKAMKQPIRIPFERIPEKMAPINALRQPQPVSMPGQKAIETPAPVALGNPAPELKVARWSEGGPVKLADLLGKIIVITFSAAAQPRLASLQREFPDQLVFLSVLNASGMGQFADQGDKVPALKYLAVAEDIAVPQQWRGYNDWALGANGGVVILDDEGRLAANNVPGNYALAKIRQLLALAQHKLNVGTP